MRTIREVEADARAQLNNLAAQAERPPKRITVTVPCDLAERIERVRKRKRRKFGPMLVRAAELGLPAAEREDGDRREDEKR